MFRTISQLHNCSLILATRADRTFKYLHANDAAYVGFTLSLDMTVPLMSNQISLELHLSNGSFEITV
jgi:hypothetical protein